MIEIRERQFEDFFNAPFECYGSKSLYTSMLYDDLKRYLDESKNPLFRNFGKFTYYTAYRDNKIVGRTTAHIHQKSNEQYSQRRLYFGHFDCINDIAVAWALLDRAAEWGKKLGCREQVGAFNLTAMQAIGVVTEGFENAPYTDQVYNAKYIPTLLEEMGFEKFFPMRTFEVDIKNSKPEEILSEEKKKILKSSRFEWRSYSRKTLKKQLDETWELLNDGFSDNPMFVPLTREEFQFQAKDLMLIIDERISFIVYEDGTPVGAVICIPDLNPMLHKMGSRVGLSTPLHYLLHRLNRKRCVVIFQSVRQSQTHMGLGATLTYHLIKSVKEAGYEKMGITWVWDENEASLRNVERIRGKQYQRLHLFKRNIH